MLFLQPIFVPKPLKSQQHSAQYTKIVYSLRFLDCCTAIGNLDHSLNQDSDTITVS